MKAFSSLLGSAKKKRAASAKEKSEPLPSLSHSPIEPLRLSSPSPQHPLNLHSNREHHASSQYGAVPGSIKPGKKAALSEHYRAPTTRLPPSLDVLNTHMSHSTLETRMDATATLSNASYVKPSISSDAERVVLSTPQGENGKQSLGRRAASALVMSKRTNSPARPPPLPLLSSENSSSAPTLNAFLSPAAPRSVSESTPSRIRGLLHSRSSRGLRESQSTPSARIPPKESELKSTANRRRALSFGSSIRTSARSALPDPATLPSPPPPPPLPSYPNATCAQSSSAPSAYRIPPKSPVPSLPPLDVISPMQMQFEIPQRDIITSDIVAFPPTSRSHPGIRSTSADPSLKTLPPASMSTPQNLRSLSSSLPMNRQSIASSAAADRELVLKTRELTLNASDIGGLRHTVGRTPSSSRSVSGKTIGMPAKRSMPELEGVWKGFLRDVEEDLTSLVNEELSDSPSSRPRPPHPIRPPPLPPVPKLVVATTREQGLSSSLPTPPFTPADSDSFFQAQQKRNDTLIPIATMLGRPLSVCTNTSERTIGPHTPSPDAPSTPLPTSGSAFTLASSSSSNYLLPYMHTPGRPTRLSVVENSPSGASTLKSSSLVSLSLFPTPPTLDGPSIRTYDFLQGPELRGILETSPFPTPPATATPTQATFDHVKLSIGKPERLVISPSLVHPELTPESDNSQSGYRHAHSSSLDSSYTDSSESSYSFFASSDSHSGYILPSSSAPPSSRHRYIDSLPSISSTFTHATTISKGSPTTPSFTLEDEMRMDRSEFPFPQVLSGGGKTKSPASSLSDDFEDVFTTRVHASSLSLTKGLLARRPETVKRIVSEDRWGKAV